MNLQSMTARTIRVRIKGGGYPRGTVFQVLLY